MGLLDIVNPSTWGGFSNPFSYIWDNISGTFVQRPADRAWVNSLNAQSTSQAGINNVGPSHLYGNYTGIGPAIIPEKTLAEAIKTQNIVSLPSAASVSNAVSSVTGLSSNTLKIGLFALGAIVVIKILK